MTVTAKPRQLDWWYRPAVVLRNGAIIDRFTGYDDLKLYDANALAADMAQYWGAEFCPGKKECTVVVDRFSGKNVSVKQAKTYRSVFDTEAMGVTIVSFFGMGFLAAIFWVIQKAYM